MASPPRAAGASGPPSPAAEGDDPRKAAFFWMNGIAFVLVATAALLAWLAPVGLSWQAVVAIVLVAAAILLAVGSYPFYRAFLRDEAAQRRQRKSRPRR